MAACVMALSTLWLDCITRSAPHASADSGALLLLLLLVGWRSAMQWQHNNEKAACVVTKGGRLQYNGVQAQPT
jgi:hypothetical protein